MARVLGVMAASTCARSMFSVRVDVDQAHVSAQVAHHLGGGGEGVRGGDDLVARADAQRLQRQVQAGGGGVDRDAFDLRVAQILGKRGLEALGLGAGGDPAGRSVSTTSAISSSPISGKAKAGKGRASSCGGLSFSIHTSGGCAAGQRVEDGVERRVHAADAACASGGARVRRSGAQHALGEQCRTRPSGTPRTSGLRVVDDEVVPDDGAAGLEPLPHGGGQALLSPASKMDENTVNCSTRSWLAARWGGGGIAPSSRTPAGNRPTRRPDAQAATPGPSGVRADSPGTRSSKLPPPPQPTSSTRQPCGPSQTRWARPRRSAWCRSAPSARPRGAAGVAVHHRAAG